MPAKNQELSLIVAFDRNRVMGVDGHLPWNLSSDLRHFKKLTTGNTVIMGRKTFESIGKALPNRHNVVISKTLNQPMPHIKIARSVEEALLCSKTKKLFFIGGYEIYRSAIEITNSMYLTLVDAQCVGDTFFPDFCVDDWVTLFEKKYQADDRNEYDFIIKKLVRKHHNF